MNGAPTKNCPSCSGGGGGGGEDREGGRRPGAAAKGKTRGKEGGGEGKSAPQKVQVERLLEAETRRAVQPPKPHTRLRNTGNPFLRTSYDERFPGKFLKIS